VSARELADRAGQAKPSMSLGVYSHVIVPDEVDAEMLKALVSERSECRSRDALDVCDAQVMHALAGEDRKAPHARGFP
jgi:hypothetical protein